MYQSIVLTCGDVVGAAERCPPSTWHHPSRLPPIVVDDDRPVQTARRGLGRRPSGDGRVLPRDRAAEEGERDRVGLGRGPVPAGRAGPGEPVREDRPAGGRGGVRRGRSGAARRRGGGLCGPGTEAWTGLGSEEPAGGPLGLAIPGSELRTVRNLRYSRQPVVCVPY